MGHGQMLRVSKIEDRLRRSPAGPGLGAHGDCVIVRSSEARGKRRPRPVPEAGRPPDGSRGLCLHLVMIPPGTRGQPHFHDGHESAFYAVSGETEVWHGDGLAKRAVLRAGDFMYVPPGTPHLSVNRSDGMSIAVVASSGPAGQQRVVDLPPHLADLGRLPVADRE